MTTRNVGWCATVLLSLTQTACLPSVLKKYTQPGTFEASQSSSAANANTEANGFDTVEDDTTKNTYPVKPLGAVVQGRAVAHVKALDPQTFIYPSPFQQTWDGALKVLLKNYTLSSIDKQAGIIITDWDSYHVGDKVYRNKLTLLVRGQGRNQTEVTIKNAAEFLKIETNNNAAPDENKVAVNDHAGADKRIWLPIDDQFQETNRIAQNVSIILNLPDPGFVKQGQIAAKMQESQSDSSQEATW